MVYGKPQDNFIWKMEKVEPLLNRMYRKLAMFFLSKIFNTTLEEAYEMYTHAVAEVLNEHLNSTNVKKPTVEDFMETIEKIATESY